MHATVAGVLLGFAVPVLRSDAAGGPEAGPGSRRALRAPVPPALGRLRRAGLRVLSPRASRSAGSAGLRRRLSDRVALGDHRRPRRRQAVGILPPPGCCPASPGPTSTPTWPGSTSSGCRCSAGIGFTVCLLIGELAFGATSARDEHVKVGVLLGCLLAALLASLLLRGRSKHYAEVAARDSVDSDEDGVPDSFQVPPVG